MLIQDCTKIADIFIVSQIFSWFTSFVFLFDITEPKLNQFTVFTRPWFNITYIFNSMDEWQASLHRQRYYAGALLWHTQRMSPWFSTNRQQVFSNTHTDFTMTVVPYQEYITLHPLTYCDLVIQSSDITSWILVNIGLGNGLFPDGTKPLPEPILIYHQWECVAFTWGQFHRNDIYLWYDFENKTIHLRLQPHLSGEGGAMS